MRQKDLNFLDRNEFNYSPSKEVVEALKNFDINKLCFYTRIYDEGKKSILSVFLSELYDIDETASFIRVRRRGYSETGRTLFPHRRRRK